MSIATALMALNADVEAAKAAIEAKGGTAPSGTADMADAIANIPSGGITPSGKKLITDTSETDVAAFATAQVVDADLVAENIKKDVNILGVVGSFEGGGGGIMPAPTASVTFPSETYDAANYFFNQFSTASELKRFIVIRRGGAPSREFFHVFFGFFEGESAYTKSVTVGYSKDSGTNIQNVSTGTTKLQRFIGTYDIYPITWGV